MHFPVAVVGGGISGLSAAYTLKKANIDAVVLEKENFPGGRMSSETIEGYLIDKGAYTIPDFYPRLMRMLDELNLKTHLVKTASTSSTICCGKAHDIKIGAIKDFLTYELLSVGDKMRLIKIALYAKSLGKAASLSRPTDKSFLLERESVADYLGKHYSDPILERIAYPIFNEIFLGSPEGNSKLAFLVTLANLSAFDIYTLDEGMGMLPQFLAKNLDVRYRTAVKKIQKGTNGTPHQLHLDRAENNIISTDAVILAAPLPSLADIIQDIPTDLKAEMKSITYAPSIVTVWGLRGPCGELSLINNFLRGETRLIGTVIADNLKATGRAPLGKTLLTVILSEAACRRLLDAPREEIQREVIRGMAVFYPSFARQVEFFKVYRWPLAAVQFPPGTLARRQALRRKIEKELGTIFIAGDSLDRTALEAGIATGIAAAKKAIINLTDHDFLR